MEILGNGRLIVQGGDGIEGIANAAEGGGAGGIIQIISPVGSLSAGSLSLGHGTRNNKASCLKETIDANGYYYLQGISI